MDGPAALTVVTWNAQGSHRIDVARAADALAAFQPDVVLLQEIQRRQLGALGAALSMAGACWRFKHWPVRVPAEGLGILARHPLESARTQVLAHRWEPWNWRRRVAVLATLRVGGRQRRVVDVHLGAGVDHAERTRQVRALLEHARDADVVAGALSAGPASAELGVFATAGWEDAEARRRAPGVPRASTNWPPGARTAPPTQRLDYLLVRDETEVLDASVP